jgi:myosin-5
VIYLQTDLEEAKAQEISKFQTTISEIQAQLEEANALVAKERELRKQAADQAASIMKEIEVIKVTEVSNAKVEKLEAENESLKVFPL